MLTHNRKVILVRSDREPVIAEISRQHLNFMQLRLGHHSVSWLQYPQAKRGFSSWCHREIWQTLFNLIRGAITAKLVIFNHCRTKTSNGGNSGYIWARRHSFDIFREMHLVASGFQIK